MQATWSQPVAEVVVFSNDFASRRARPSRPWATSTRQAWRIGRNTGCLSSPPTRPTPKPPRPPNLRAPAAGGAYRSEHRLLVAPPAPPHLKALASAKLACAGRGDATVHQDQLEL